MTEILREDYGYAGSVDLVRRRLAELRPTSGAAGAEDGLPAGAGDAGRLGGDADAAEDRRARAAGLRVDLHAAVLGRVDGALHVRHDDRVVPAGPRPRVRRGSAAFRASASTTTCARRSRERDGDVEVITGTRGSRSCAATTPFTRTPARRARRGRRARLRARSAITRRGSGRRGASDRCASSTRSTPTGATGSRCRAATPPAATSSPSAWRSSARRCGRCRRSHFDAAGAAVIAGPAGRLPQARRAASTARRRRWFISASSCAGTATASGSSTTARPSPPTSAATSTGSLAARAADAPRAAAGRAGRRDRRAAGRPAGAQPTTPSSAHDQTKTAAVGDRLPYLLAQAQGAARPGAAGADRRDRARRGGWPYEQFLETLLEAEVFARDASGARNRIRHAAFPAHKTLEDFDFTAQPAAEKPLILHLAQLAWTQRAHERLLLRAARHRQDAPRDRAGDQGLPGRPPRRVRDRPAMGRPPRRPPSTATPSTTNSNASSATA